MRKIANFAGIALLTIMLGACNTIGTTTAVVTVEKPTLAVPPVDPIRLRDVDWYIISKNATVEQAGHIDQVWKRSKTTSLFALSSQDYEDLSVNTANMLKIIRQYQSQVKAYEDYYKQADKEPKDAPKAAK
jgi:hypothetical protein